MNTFISEKLGEVLAFARIGQDTLKKGRKALLKLQDATKLQKIGDKLDDIEEKVIAFASNEGVSKIVEKEAKEAKTKVMKMRDIYIAGKWSESSEVLEWMGFYTGAALVHWYLISGAGKSLKITKLESISRDAIKFYTSLFVTDEKVLQKIGAKGSEE